MDSENTIPPSTTDSTSNNDSSSQPQAVTMYTETVAVHDWRYATFLERFAALVLDLLLLFPIYYFIDAISLVSSINLNSEDKERILNVLFLLYNVVSLSIYGTTFGKHIMKLKVISDDLKSLTFGHIFIRETIGKLLSAILVGYGYTAMIFHPRKQTWHDRMAKTLVVKYPSKPVQNAVILYIGLYIGLIAVSYVIVSMYTIITK